MYSREEEKQLRKEFWTGFDEFCNKLPRFKYRKKKWILYNTKIKGVEMKFDANRDGAFVILEFNHHSEDVRLALMALMEKYHVVVDEHFAGAIWQLLHVKPCGTPVSRIYKQKEGIDIHKREHWAEFYPFLSREMNMLEKVYTDMRELIEEVVSSGGESDIV